MRVSDRALVAPLEEAMSSGAEELLAALYLPAQPLIPAHCQLAERRRAVSRAYARGQLTEQEFSRLVMFIALERIAEVS